MILRILFTLTICITTSSYAGIDEGVDAYQRGDYAAALQEFTALAKQDNAKAELQLGYMYELGRGVVENSNVAITWFRKAANHGSEVAQFKLGKAYLNGQGVAQDYEQAYKWILKSAESGFSGAQSLLGDMYEKGEGGVTQNSKEANKWHMKASGQTSPVIQTSIAPSQEKLKCLKNASTLLFGEALNCIDKEALRNASKQAGAKVTREDNGYWYDLYDSSELLEGTSELSIAYMNGKFAEAYYKYDSFVDRHKVLEVRDLVVSKYGKPASSEGNPSLGPVTYTWKLKDGIKVVVERAWPDTTVYLKYIHPANYAAMQAEIKRQANAEENDKRSKQSKAF